MHDIVLQARDGYRELFKYKNMNLFNYGYI